MSESSLRRENHQLRARLAELEDRTWQGDPVLRSIMESSTDGIMLLDLHCRIRFTNRPPRGLHVEQVIGTSLFEHLPEEQHANVRYCFERVLHSGEPDSYEVVHESADGGATHEQARVAPVASGGATSGFVVTTSDVSERRAATRERDRFFRLSLDMLGIATLDGLWKRVNPAFEQALGYPEEELRDRPLVELVHPDDREATLRALDRLEGGADGTHFENRYRTRDGEHRVLSWQAAPDRETGRLYLVARDITEARVLQERLRQSQKMDAVGQLAGGIAHDFNNLALAILVNAEFALEELDPGQPVVEHIHQIQSAGQRAAELTQQLLAFSRRQPLRAEDVHLDRLVARIRSLLQRITPNDVRLEYVPTSEGMTMHGDPGQIEQVLLNLCVNARDAMPDGGTITIRTGRKIVDDEFRRRYGFALPGHYTYVQVEDQGSGMEPGVLDRAFEPFYTTKAPGRGTGLGLSTVYGIVKQHGGFILADTQEGRGSTFTAYLPDADASAPAPEVAVPKPHARPPRRETILLAEHDEGVRQATVRVLERAGYAVLEAEDGEVALRLLQERKSRVHMALLDVVMPRLTGPETFSRLRERYPGLPALFTRGQLDRAAPEPSLPDGAVVLQKPYRSDELLRLVRRALDGAA